MRFALIVINAISKILSWKSSLFALSWDALGAPGIRMTSSGLFEINTGAPLVSLHVQIMLQNINCRCIPQDGITCGAYAVFSLKKSFVFDLGYQFAF